MNRSTILPMLLLVLISFITASAHLARNPQLARNPKIAAPDLEAAKAETLASGGEQAELIYAARIDAVTRGNYDSLIVIYAKPVKTGQNYFAVILREGQKFPLIADKKDKLARAFPTGDKYLRMGLRHEEGKSPLVRLMASAIDKEKGEQQHNLDFQFNGTEFVMVAQSMMPLPK